MKISEIKSNLKIGDKIYILKKHFIEEPFTIKKTHICCLTPKEVIIEKLSFFYEKEKGIYSQSIKVEDGNQWYSINSEGEDYFIKKKDAINYCERKIDTIVKELEEFKKNLIK